MHGGKRTILIAGLLALGASHVAHAQGDHTIRSGAVAVGASGSFTSVEGSSSGAFGIHLGYFGAPSGFVIGYFGGWDYAHVADLDLVELDVGVRVMRRIGESSAYPYLGVAGGLRQEWVGSFSQGRFPAGVDVGMLALPGSGASLGAAYEFRRIFDDPISDFNEHRLVIAISILFRND